MSLWGKQENVSLTGTITIVSGDTTVAGVGTTFTTQLQAGDTIQYDKSGNTIKFVVASISNNTSLKLKSVPDANDAVAGSVFAVTDAPKFSSNQDAKSNVEKITTADAKNPAFKAVGVNTPGWVKSITYVDANGKTRTKSETLVVFKS